jgi:hypothetical protein
MRTEPLTKEEIVARLRAALKENPRPRPNRPPRTKAQASAERLATANKPTVAIAQDVALSNDALAQRLREERELKLADAERRQRQHALDMAVVSMRGLQREIVHSSYYKGSATVGPRDSDADLHLSPEDALWMNHHVQYSS